MNIQNIILGLIKTSPKTGYELKQIFDSSLGFFAGASFGSIYPILKKLEKHGMVKKQVEIQDGKPNRNIYSITPRGEATFFQGLSEKLTISSYRNEFLIRLFFFSSISRDEHLKFAKEYLRYLQDKFTLLKSMEPLAREQADAYQFMCYKFGMRHMKSLISSTKQLIDELKRYDQTRSMKQATKHK